MTYILASLIVLLAVLGMAVGVIFGRARIRGSCGGVANMRDKDGNILCDACSHPSPDCTGNPDEQCGEEPEGGECAAGSHHAEHDRCSHRHP
jgi:hypothetical protein